MAAFHSYNDLSLVIVSDFKGSANEILRRSRRKGSLFGVLVRARSSIRSGRRRWLKNLSLSPEMENLYLLAPTSNTEDILQEAIVAAGLNHGAIGAAMAVPIRQLYGTEFHLAPTNENGQLTENPDKVTLQKDLRLITCVCQRGKAEMIATAAVNEGSTAPIIHFGEGKGVRDRMGLLKIAINPEKEIIQVVTDSLECDRIFDAMVETGKLYAPGMGFIYTTEIPIGFVNLHTTVSTSFTEATTEQIIKAIDELKGSKNWRLASVGLSPTRRVARKERNDLILLKLVTRRGLGDEIIYKAMHKGASGATRTYGNLLGAELIRSQAGHVINDEREVIDFHVTQEAIPAIRSAMEESISEHNSQNSFLMEIPVPRALTYFG